MSGSWITRRRFGALTGGALASAALGCGNSARGQEQEAEEPGSDGRIFARPRKGVTTTAQADQPLGLGGTRDAILRLPAKPAGALPPLLVLLHGAGGSGAAILRRLGEAADLAGVAVLAPDSRGATWDAIRGGYGRDVIFLNKALERVFKSLAVDPARVSVGGFSDGATYALSLGLINGDVFKRIVAFSPGFIVERNPHGKPDVFISHGVSDPILPIDRCSRTIVARLRSRGYQIEYREFNGGHEVPADIARDAMAWVAETAVKR